MTGDDLILPDVPFQPVLPDELVVDLPHRALVVAELRDLTVLAPGDPETIETDPRLGLALLTGLDLTAVRPRVLAAHGPVIEQLEKAGPLTPLDLLLFELRALFRGRWDGWAPEMGKNRMMARVVGCPYYCPMSGPRVLAEGEPTPVVFPDGVRPPRPVSDAGRGVRVGVLDTRLYPHRDIEGRYLAPPGAVYRPDDGQTVQAWAGHATFVADLVLAQAPAAELDLRWVLDSQHGKATAWETVRRIVDFADSGVDVLNLSLGCFTDDGEPPLTMVRAIERLHSDTLVVAAAGNHGAITGTDGLTSVSPYWPAALPNVVSVGADRVDADRADAAPAAKRFSPEVPWISCTAPGVGVVAAFLDATVELWDGDPPVSKVTTFDGYARWSGTSFAAATVSGAIAAAMRPGLTAREAYQALLDDPGSVVTPYALP